MLLVIHEDAFVSQQDSSRNCTEKKNETLDMISNETLPGQLMNYDTL